MKKVLIWVLTLVLLLCGCGSTRQRAEEVQNHCAAWKNVRVEAEITCHLEGESRSFTVVCTSDENGATTTITAPEELSGMSATISGREMLVNYGGAALSAGTPPVLSPANCVPYLLYAAKEGYLLEHGEETIDGLECLRLALDTTASDGEKILCTVWFETGSGVPHYAEFSRDGLVKLTIRTLSFEIIGKEE